MKVFTVLRYILLGGILGYLVAEAVIHGFINRYAQVPSFHALCPFEAFGNFLNTLTGLEFFSNPFASASIFLLFLIVLAIALNRVFCGFLCAFGALQEFVGNIGKKVLKKRFAIPKKADRILRALKYVFLFLSVLLAYFTGFEFFKNIFAQGASAFSHIDPWIAFKSLLSNNLLVTGYIGSLALLVISLVGSFFFERFYCKYICPLGGLFAIFGSLSGLHIFRNVRPADEDAEPVSEECGGNCACCAMNCGGDVITEDAVAAPEEGGEETESEAPAEDLPTEEAEPVAEESVSDNASADVAEAGSDDVPSDNEGELADDEYYEDEYIEYDEEPEEEIIDNYCINCGKCSEVCPMGIDVANADGNIDFAECISCQKCVAACPKKGALQTRYFGAKSHPIIILLITFIVFFGAAFAFNFITVDRGNTEKEPIYDSIHLAPKAPADGKFSVKDIMDQFGMTLDELKAYYSLSDAVTENSGYSEYCNAYTLKYFKENDEARYKEIISFFGLSEDTPLETSLGEIYDNAPISVAAEDMGFDPEKIEEFAAYFGAKPDDKFETIRDRYNELYDAYMEIKSMDEAAWSSYIANYGYWYQCAYGAKATAAKNFFELAQECEYKTALDPLTIGDRFTIQYLLDNEGITLDEFIKTYHVKEGAITSRSPYSAFADGVKLSYYKEMYASAAQEGQEDEFPKMLAIYGLTPETADLEMTVGELLESGTVTQAAKFYGYETEEDINNFLSQNDCTDPDAPYSAIHEAVNKSMDDYYNMLYAYYTSGYEGFN